MTTKAITANRLRQGDVVYLTTAGSWSENIQDALLIDDPEAVAKRLAQAEADAGADDIVGPYSFSVDINGGIVMTKSRREWIRVHGPSTDIPAEKVNRHVPI
jgi:hypothetical protein